jgi:hypothetical protein
VLSVNDSYQISRGICPICFYQLSSLNIGTVKSCNNCHRFFSSDLSTGLFTIQNYSPSYNIHENKINKENEMKFEFIDLSDDEEKSKENNEIIKKKDEEIKKKDNKIKRLEEEKKEQKMYNDFLSEELKNLQQILNKKGF